MAKLMGRERAIILAQLAVQIDDYDHQPGWIVAKSVERAEEILVAAEDSVAKKYGEYR